jgi:hypothetical protein
MVVDTAAAGTTFVVDNRGMVVDTAAVVGT